MPTKIRLQRRGKKGQPFYHIVIADQRAPRDGKFIEKIGTYNPLNVPAVIELNFDRALFWYQKGAQPTNTVKAILSYKGILYKNHLLKGVQKGVFTLEQAEEKFQTWINQKLTKIQNEANSHLLKAKDDQKSRLKEETKINELRAAKLAERLAQAAKAEEAQDTQEQEAEPGAETAEPAISNETSTPEAESNNSPAQEEPKENTETNQ